MTEDPHTMQLCLDAASAVVSIPSLSKRAAQAFRRAQDLVLRHGSDGDGLPRLRVFAGRHNGMGAAICNHVVAFAHVVSAISSHATDSLVFRNFIEKVG